MWKLGGNMDVGYFFIGDIGLHVARHLAQEISNIHFVSLHKTARTEESYRQLLALPSRLSPIDTRFTNQYYNEIPDYIESPKGQALFCSTEVAQFGSFRYVRSLICCDGKTDESIGTLKMDIKKRAYSCSFFFVCMRCFTIKGAYMMIHNINKMSTSPKM